MAKEDSLSLFPEVEEITQDLTDSQFGALIRALFAYYYRGITYNGDDPMIRMGFRVVSGQLDRRDAAKKAKSVAAQRRWSLNNDAEVMQSDANTMQSIADHMQSDAEVMQSDAPILSNPILSNPILSKESKADEPPAPTKKQARKAFGHFGWVKLTDEEYNRLLNDLGQAEVERCISYIDESAQTTKNKNKWRDWNLVIRKCSRDGWGIQRQKNHVKEIPKGASGVLGEAELEAIQRVLREG